MKVPLASTHRSLACMVVMAAAAQPFPVHVLQVEVEVEVEVEVLELGPVGVALELAIFTGEDLVAGDVEDGGLRTGERKTGVDVHKASP